jgi:hypothetical protein
VYNRTKQTPETSQRGEALGILSDAFTCDFLGRKVEK